ncbi:DUF2835 family protein [Alteromonas sp. 1_MG-2023]|uniref:DUF2835 family protein n=1 Tax=Alteromonas sp. 1_MG-2023 TaxID=3062669 RepID=UPI0026E2D530|nr:DUF2835 family protein [Alteromonas sp. 1_MG-2023]MDO6565884.1 DUF2835 family protein [Alteromonas sp. 1_MG-2023]
MTTILATDTVYYFSVNVPYIQCEALYSGTMPNVVMVAENGTSVQVPSSRIKQFITSQGVIGRFRMVVDTNRKIKAFERLR